MSILQAASLSKSEAAFFDITTLRSRKPTVGITTFQESALR